MTTRRLSAALLTLLLAAAPAVAQPAPLDADAAADALRDGIGRAYAAGDVAAMGRYLHPDVQIVFPDGRVLIGVDALKDYYDEMLTGPNAVVGSYQSDPKVTGRAVEGDAVVSHGDMNDRYVLADGTSFALNSVFTVTLVRAPDGPPETGGLVIRSFHSSTDAFDNPVLALAARRGASTGAAWTAAVVGPAALGIGVIAGWWVGRRRPGGAGAHRGGV